MHARRFIQFLISAGSAGVTSMVVALVLFVISIVEHVRGANLTSYVLVCVAALMFSVGAYSAWAKEHEQYESEKEKHDNPNLELNVVSILTRYEPALNVTTLCFAGVVVNRGSPSIAFGWKVRYQSQSIDMTIAFVSPPDDEQKWVPVGGRQLILRRDAMLPAKTLIPIERGHSLHGRVLFEIPGNREDEIYSGAAQMWIGCTDTTGRVCQTLFQTGPAHRVPFSRRTYSSSL